MGGRQVEELDCTQVPGVIQQTPGVGGVEQGCCIQKIFGRNTEGGGQVVEYAEVHSPVTEQHDPATGGAEQETPLHNASEYAIPFNLAHKFSGTFTQHPVGKQQARLSENCVEQKMGLQEVRPGKNNALEFGPVTHVSYVELIEQGVVGLQHAPVIPCVEQFISEQTRPSV